MCSDSVCGVNSEPASNEIDARHAGGEGPRQRHEIHILSVEWCLLWCSAVDAPGMASGQLAGIT